MGKKSKIALNIFFWLFVFGIGLLIILFLPRVYSYTILYDEVNQAIISDKEIEAYSLLEKYYDSTLAYQSEDRKITIAPTVSKEKADDKEILSSKYTVIIKNVDKTIVNNVGVKVLVNDSYPINIIDIDTDDDKKLDGVSTLVQYDFIYFAITSKMVDQINEIKILDSNGNIYLSYSLSLSFSESFFEDVKPVVEEFNTNGTLASASEFLNKKDTYKTSDLRGIDSRANLRTTLMMILYSFIVLLFYDIVLGFHFSWILPKKFYFKYIKKEKAKKNTSVEEEVPYQGNTKINASATVPIGFSDLVKITYQNVDDGSDFTIVLRKGAEYHSRLAVKAGTYKLISVEPNVKVEGLPENLVLKKYFYELAINIIKGGLTDETSNSR